MRSPAVIFTALAHTLRGAFLGLGAGVILGLTLFVATYDDTPPPGSTRDGPAGSLPLSLFAYSVLGCVTLGAGLCTQKHCRSLCAGNATDSRTNRFSGVDE